ncbi:hypothetical protein ACQEVF_57500 [Nonomuraea polychroma]|uniref:hypothetical protein n=1 Tax=Nonomuraea polychroma TaxID=46176 RepID=UPI003D924A5E
MLCELHEGDRSWFHNSLNAGQYLAAVHCGTLPQPFRRDDHTVSRGYAVGFGHWFFFDAIEPAIAFGRAARMSLDCHGYGVYEAAHEVMFCRHHGTDERVLLVTGDNLDRRDDEVELLTRFVQGVREHPWSAHWHAPRELAPASTTVAP